MFRIIKLELWGYQVVTSFTLRLAVSTDITYMHTVKTSKRVRRQNAASSTHSLDWITNHRDLWASVVATQKKRSCDLSIARSVVVSVAWISLQRRRVAMPKQSQNEARTTESYGSLLHVYTVHWPGTYRPTRQM